MPEITVDAAPGAREGAGLSRGLLLLMAVATGLSVANIYYNQPLLGLMERGLGRGATATASATQIGYALGMLLLVPLGDRLNRRRVIFWQGLALVAALAAVAAAPNVAALIAASVAVGITASIAQQIVPFAAELARPEARGAVVGVVMSGLLGGILLARTLSGFLGEALGWRATFWIGAAIALAMTATLTALLPASTPRSRASYGQLLASLVELAGRYPELRRAALTQGALFAAFSAFWATLALLLERPPYHLGSAAAGLYGVVALSGVLMAPVAGRLADRYGARWVIRLGIAAIVAAFALMGAWPTLIGLGLGVMIMDGGVQSSMVANQTAILSLGEGERSRINTIYVTGIFVGGAIGSQAGVLAWHLGGWSWVAALGAAFALLGLVPQFVRLRP